MAWVQAIPLLPVLALLPWHRRASTASLWLVAAFCASWVGDTAAYLLGGSWAAVYVWLPCQLGLAAFAVLSDGTRRLLALFMLGGFTAASVMATYPGPEIILTAVGSAALVTLVRGPLEYPIRLYFGAGSLCYLLWLNEWAIGWWWAYQLCRLASMVALVLVIRGTHAEGERLHQ